jgi:hypothetical protein
MKLGIGAGASMYGVGALTGKLASQYNLTNAQRQSQESCNLNAPTAVGGGATVSNNNLPTFVSTVAPTISNCAVSNATAVVP